MQRIVHFSVGDTLELKKAHPCGCARFSVVRTGSEVRIICLGCGRDMTVGREKLDRAIKKVIAAEGKTSQGATDPDTNRKDGTQGQ